jgi:trigger factor
LKASVSEPQSWKRVLDIEIPAEDVEAAFGQKLTQYRKKIALPGFRAGKVPPQMVRARFGESIRAELIEELIQKSFEDACKEKAIVPIAQAKVSNLKADEGAAVSFSIETEVEPPIEVKGYQKLKVKPSPDKIKSGDVDKLMQELRESHATFKDVERPSKDGDFVSIEYQKVLIDGAERKDITSPRHPVQIGESKIKGFDKELEKRRPDETFDATITFPRDYGDADIAGKKAVIGIKMLKVQERELPQVNEEFLKKIGEFSTEAELREFLQKDLESREARKAKSDAANKAIDMLIKANPFDIPPSRVEHYIDYMLEESKRYAGQGQTPPTREQVAERYHEQGVHMMKRHRIINFIATKENIKATAAEVDRQIELIAKQYNQPFDSVKDALRRNGTTARIREDIREQKTLEYLIGEYDPSAVAPEPEAKPEAEQPLVLDAPGATEEPGQ